LAFALLYIVVSNTLWLLFGSRVLQCLPGVDIKGIAGTLKIAAMLVLSALGVLMWALKYIYLSLIRRSGRPRFKDEVGNMIQRGARMVARRRVKRHISQNADDDKS